MGNGGSEVTLSTCYAGNGGIVMQDGKHPYVRKADGIDGQIPGQSKRKSSLGAVLPALKRLGSSVRKTVTSKGQAQTRAAGGYARRRRLMERLLRYENHYSSGAEGHPPKDPSCC